MTSPSKQTTDTDLSELEKQLAATQAQLTEIKEKLENARKNESAHTTDSNSSDSVTDNKAAVTEQTAVSKETNSESTSNRSEKQRGQTLIELREIKKSFGQLKVLDGINLTIKRGETVVFIGQSGTGKSVTLRIILGLLKPDSGTMFFEEQDIAKLTRTEQDHMLTRYAMLFQGGALFDSMTVGENISFGAKLRGMKNDAEIDALVARVLAEVDLPNTENKMPGELSGGMKKRAALARALALQPEIILYDEPTTGLDPIMSDAIADLIIQTREQLQEKHLTSIVVTHDMRVAFKVADRVVMLHKGKVVGDAPPEEFERLGKTETSDKLTEVESMIRQFVRGDAVGPI